MQTANLKKRDQILTGHGCFYRTMRIDWQFRIEEVIMIRNVLKIYHHRCLRNMPILFWMLLILPNYSFAAEDIRDQLQRFLKNDMAFSEKELNSFKEGKTVAKTLKIGTKHEVGIFGIAKVNVPRELFLQNYKKKE